jgi:YHS domain-containing protein/adenylate kinase family enzyme
MDKKTQEKLNKILLSSSTKRNLWLIKSIEVSEALDVFWDAIPKNEKETADYDGVEKCFMLICRLMLPGLKQENLEMFTQDLLGASKMRETSHFTQDEFFEALLSLADLFTECLDIQTATTFLEFAINRVTQKVIVKATGERERVQGTLAVNFYNTQNLNKSLKDELNSPQQPENVIYVKEHYQMTPIETGIEDSVITNLRELDSILPLGTAVNEVINDQINDRTPKENYEISNSHELNASLSKAETLFYIGFIIEDTDGKAIRLNPALFSPYFFEKLQDKSGNTIFVNQRSIYDNAASIDKVYEMTKRWNDKLVVPKPSEQEIWDKPIEDICKVLVQGKFRFNKKDDEAEAKDLDFKTSDTFPTIHSEKFAMFRTREPDLPKDTLNPYAEDLITYAKERPFHILVHGKPKIGKSKFCKTLAQKLDLELIDIDVFVQNFLKRVQEGEENIQNDDEGNPIEFLKPFERQAITAIRRGERISHENLLAIINDEISKLRVEHKGCVFEVPCFDNPTKQMNYLQLIQDGKMHINNQKPVFNVVIELYVKDDQLLNRTRQIRENANPANFITISEAEQKTPVEKVKKEGDDDDDDDADIDPDDPKIIKEENLYRRINESDVVVWKGLINYKETVRPIVEKLEGSVHHLNNIFVDYDTLTVAQAVDTIYAKLFPRSKFLRPISASIEDAGEEDYASLTKANLKTDEGELMRRWSLFYKHDPVALFNKKVQKGLSQFSCEYAGRIFCFANEQNKALFIKDPKPYLLEVPKLPKQFNVSIVGMTNTGKKLYAQKIAEKYGLEIVDLPALILKKYEEQSKWEQHIPNNPEGGSVHFSKNEFAELKKGTGFDTRLALPLLLHDKGIHLYKRPPPPKDPAELEEEERLRKEEEERKAEEAKKKKKLAAKKDEKKEEAPPKEPSVPVLEDFNLTDLVPKPDEKGVVPELKGYIFIDFPISEAQINTMKEMNINLDRLIILKEPDTTEAGEPEEPGNVITKRPNFFEKTTFADEQAYLEAASNAIKAGGIEEDRITEIFSGNIEQTFMKIRQFIDPFELRIDDDSTALPVEEGDFSEKILFGEYGNYCPVTAVDNNWLILGKPELEVQVRGYRYRFYNEDCKKKFEENIEKYVAPPESPPVPPEPRIFMTGCSGSGLHTNIERLQAKLRIPIVNFRSEFKNVTEHMKMQRKEERRRLKGFTLTAPEDGAPIEDIKDEPDPEIENDPDDFDVTKSEQQITNLILGKLGAAIINCRMDPPPKPDPVLIDEPEQDEEEELDENGEPKVKEEPPAKEDEPPEEILKQPFVELLTETKRLPELIIILTVSEVEMLKRRFNKKKIQDIYDHTNWVLSLERRRRQGQRDLKRWIRREDRRRRRL